MKKSELVRLASLQEEFEWRRCKKDADYFFRTYVKTVDKNSETGYSLFDMTDYQREDLHAFENNSQICILKARQLGISTLVSAYVLWKLIFEPGFNVITTSKSDVAAQSNNAKLTFAYHNLPEFIKARFKVLSETTSVFKIKRLGTNEVSMMRSVAATETVGASDTYDLAILDEFALSSYQEKTYSTVKPAVRIAMNRKKSAAIIILSTPRGAYNTFAQMFRQAEAGINGFKAIFHPWWVSPWMTQEDYDLEAIAAREKGTPWEVYSEYPSNSEEAFRESGQPLFRNLPPVQLLNKFPLVGNCFKEEHADGTVSYGFEEDPNGPLHLMYRPDENDRNFYVIGFDPSSGEGSDYQAAHIMTIDEDDDSYTPKIVGYYHSNRVKPKDAATDLAYAGFLFRGRQRAAVFAVERAGGWQDYPIGVLNELKYPNGYTYRDKQTRSKSGAAASRPFAIPMTPATKPKFLQKLLEYMVPSNPGGTEVPKPKIQNLYPELRSELGSFVKQETPSGQIKFAADTGAHDDLVMSLAISLWVLLDTKTNKPSAQEGTNSENTLQSHVQMLRAQGTKPSFDTRLYTQL